MVILHGLPLTHGVVIVIEIFVHFIGDLQADIMSIIVVVLNSRTGDDTKRSRRSTRSVGLYEVADMECNEVNGDGRSR